MRHLKLFQGFISEAYQEGDDFLIYLIDQEGNLVDKRGYARVGEGIYALDNRSKYIGGIDLEGNLWYNQDETIEIDNQTFEVILNDDGKPLPTWETNHKYLDLVYQYQKEVIKQNRVAELFRMRYDLLPEIKREYPELETQIEKLLNAKRTGII